MLYENLAWFTYCGQRSGRAPSRASRSSTRSRFRLITQPQKRHVPQATHPNDCPVCGRHIPRRCGATAQKPGVIPWSECQSLRQAQDDLHGRLCVSDPDCDYHGNLMDPAATSSVD